MKQTNERPATDKRRHLYKVVATAQKPILLAHLSPGGVVFLLVWFATSLDSMDDGPVFPTSPERSRMFAFSTHSHTHSASCALLCCVIVCVHRQSIKFSIVLRVYQGWVFFHSFTRHFGQSGRVAFYRYQYIIRRLFAREGAPARLFCVGLFIKLQIAFH